MASAASPPPRRTAEDRVSALIEDAIGRFSPPSRDLLGGVAPQRAAEPLRLLAIDLEALRGEGAPVRLRQVGWRSLLVSPLGGARSADVDGVDELSFSHFARGAAVDRLVSAGARLDEHVGEADDEKAEIVESDALRVAALLHSSRRIVVPYLGLPQRVMDWEEFSAAVRERAATMLGAGIAESREGAG